MIGSIRASLNRPISLVWATLAKGDWWQRQYQAQPGSKPISIQWLVHNQCRLLWRFTHQRRLIPFNLHLYIASCPDWACTLENSECNFSQSTESSNAGVDDEDADEYKCKAVTEEEFSATQALLARCASHQEARGKSHQAGPPPSEPPKSRLDRSNLNASENTSPATKSLSL